ncbi:MAG TPA: family 16 glycosylhydrolase [Opitutaceae bacterium]|jgi:beta-glucanase (GH16 family)
MLSVFSARAALLAALVAAPALAQSSGPVLVWNDEFAGPAGSGPDPSQWNYDLGGGGWGNNELETYTNSRSNSVIVDDPLATDGKALALRAQSANGSYTSARLQTEGTFSFKYGRLECRARIPSGVGLWPAFWALGSDLGTAGWPACGEIDCLEWVGQYPSQVAGSLNFTNYNSGTALTADYILSSGVFGDAYHVFAVDWYPGEIVFSVDGVVYEDRKQSSLPAGSAWPYDQPFFLIMNLAVGGNWPGPPNSATVFPQDFRVDYVRIYALPATPPANLVYPPDAPAEVTAFSPAPGQVALNWTAPANTDGAALTGYRADRATDPAFTQNLVSTTVASGTTYVDTSVSPGTTYYYRVAAITANGVSVPSAIVQSAVVAAAPNSHVVNISSRARVGTGSDLLIAGFVIGGTSAETVLVRASGPALAGYGIGDFLPDPELQLYRGNNVIASNVGWAADGDIATAANAAGAFSWGSAATPDSALLVTLMPGPYTAIVSGASGDMGVSLLEAYAVTLAD